MLQLLKFQNESIQVFGTVKNPLFIAKEVATILGYEKTRNAVKQHVWDKNKCDPETALKRGGVKNCPEVTKTCPQNTMLLNEAGLYQLIFGSKLPIAESFQDWVFEEVLPTIRKTGSFAIVPKHNQIVLINEADLQKQFVKYINKFHPNLPYNASLGELVNDTTKKRMESKALGYTAGVCDLSVFVPNHHYGSFNIEFKTPNGKGIISDKQKIYNRKLNMYRSFSLISDDYDVICKAFNEYMSTVRVYCQHKTCNKRFKTEITLKNHVDNFHKGKI